jgi:hypothetical protein
VLVGPLGFLPGSWRAAAQSQTMVDSDDSDDDDAIMAFALSSSAQLAFLTDWDSDSSDEEDLVDYRTLPRSTHRSP